MLKMTLVEFANIIDQMLKMTLVEFANSKDQDEMAHNELPIWVYSVCLLVFDLDHTTLRKHFFFNFANVNFVVCF